MSKTVTIALSAIAGLGILTWIRLLNKEKNKSCCCETTPLIKKVIRKENNLDSIKETHPKTTKKQETKQRTLKVTDKIIFIKNTKKNNYKKDLDRWGTKQGIIEVADKTIFAKKTEKNSYKNNLERWGTKQGLLEVSNAEKNKLEKKELISKIEQISNDLKNTSPLQKDLSITQITATNTTDQPRMVNLWGGNKETQTGEIIIPQLEDHQIQKQTKVGIHPQGIAIHPVTHYAYIANQLSNTISVIDTAGTVIDTIQLEPTFAGQNSPVDIAINTNTSSPNHGNIYVVGSVANTISIINENHQIIETLPTGNRPISIAYNPINDSLYVANIADDTLSVIDNNHVLTATLPTGESPRAVAINTTNGDILVVNSKSDNITIYDKNNNAQPSLIGITKPTALAYHKEENQFYVVIANDQVLILNPDYNVTSTLSVGTNPYAITYNPHNQHIYVGNRADNTYSLLKNNTVEDTLSLGTVNIGLAIHPNENLLYSSDTSQNSITIINGGNNHNTIELNEGYREKKEEFKFNPALIKHVKIIFSGTERSHLLKIKKATIAGQKKETNILLHAYQAPQNFQNISELYTMEGTIIDGQTTWELTLAPKQTLTILIHYKQINKYNLLTSKQT